MLEPDSKASTTARWKSQFRRIPTRAQVRRPLGARSIYKIRLIIRKRFSSADAWAQRDASLSRTRGNRSRSGDSVWRGSASAGAPVASRAETLSREHVDNVCRRSPGALRRQSRCDAVGAPRPGQQQHSPRGAILHWKDIRQIRRQRNYHFWGKNYQRLPLLYRIVPMCYLFYEMTVNNVYLTHSTKQEYFFYII